MAQDTHSGSAPSMTSLVSGIVNDAQELIKQQLAMFRAEIKEDLRKTKQASLALGVGAGVALLGGLFLCLALAFLLWWATPLPLWGAFAIVGGIFAIVGGVMIFAGKKKFDSFNPLPDQSAEALKENVECLITN